MRDKLLKVEIKLKVPEQGGDLMTLCFLNQSFIKHKFGLKIITLQCHKLTPSTCISVFF